MNDQTTPAGASSPKYVEIYQTLRHDILTGTYPEGSFLPTETELTQAFGASRTTIRNAIRLLKADNLLRVTQGRGTEILPVKQQDGYDFTLSGRTTVTTNVVGNQDGDVVGQPSTIDVIPASREVAEALGIPESSDVYRLQREKIIDGTPFLYVISYLRHDDFPGLEQYDGTIYFLYKFLEEQYGTRFSATEINISATAADFIQSRLLGVPVGSPLLMQTRRTYQDTRVLELSHSYCRPEFMSITVKTTPENQETSPFLTRGF